MDFRVASQSCDDHLDFIRHPFGEQRAQGPVNQARGEDGALAGTPFTALEATGDASCGVEPLLEVHAEREEIHAFARLGGRGRGKHDRIAGSDGYRTVCQFGKRTSLDGDFALANASAVAMLLHVSV